MNRLRLLLAVVFVSSAALFAHRALQEAAPLAIAAWRLGFASFFFLVWEVADRRTEARASMTASDKGRLVLAGFCLALHFLVWFASLHDIPIARSTLLVCTTPLWTALGGMVLKHRLVSKVYWSALGLAAIGIWLVTRTATEPHTALSLRGDLLALTGGLFMAVYLISMEGLHILLSTRLQVTVTYSVAALALWATLLVRGGVTLHYSVGTWEAMIGMAIGPQILGHTLLNNSLRHFPSSTVAFAILLEPVVAAVLAWLLLRQVVTQGQMVGGILVLIGLALVIAQRSNKKIETLPSL